MLSWISPNLLRSFIHTVRPGSKFPNLMHSGHLMIIAKVASVYLRKPPLLFLAFQNLLHLYSVLQPLQAASAFLLHNSLLAWDFGKRLTLEFPNTSFIVRPVLVEVIH